MSVAYLDTHVAVFLHDGLLEELSSEAKRQIEASDLLISPMVFLELEYLFERQRITVDAKEMFTILSNDFGVSMCALPFAKVAWAALGVTWTSDPFDRLIAAQAVANQNALLITRDKLIRRNYGRAIW